MLRLSNACHLQTVWQTLPSSKIPSSTPTTCNISEESVKVESSTDDNTKPWIPEVEIIPTIPSLPSVSKELCSSSVSESRPVLVKNEEVTHREAKSEFEKEIPAALIMAPPSSITRSETSTSSTLSLSLSLSLEKDEDEEDEEDENEDEEDDDDVKEISMATFQETPRAVVETSLPLPPPLSPTAPPPCSSFTPSSNNDDDHTDSMDHTPPPSIPSMESMTPTLQQQQQQPKSRRRYHFLGSRSTTPEVSPSPSHLDAPLVKMSKRKTLTKKIKKVFTNSKAKKG